MAVFYFIRTKPLAGAVLAGAFFFSSALWAAERQGAFKGEAGESVRGSVTVSSNGTIQFSSGFKSSDGPDLYVFLGNGRPTQQVAKLSRTSGSQSYKISASLSARYSTVFVHCKRFNHIFGRAKLK